MAYLSIYFFGEFRIHYQGEIVASINKSRVQELLAWLLLHRDSPQSRHHIALKFWPDCEESQAMTNLRNTLYYLRKTLPQADQYITAEQHTINWNRTTEFYFDVSDFEESIQAAREPELDGNSDERIVLLERAADLYKGTLLEPIYADWLDSERDRLRTEAVNVLKSLVELLEVRRDYNRAIQITKRWIEIDPYIDNARLKLIQLYSLNGDRSNAMMAYKSCKEFFRNELETEPSDQIQELYSRISAGSLLSEITERNRSMAASDQDWELIGRDKECGILNTAWKEVLHQSDSGMVLVKGEPGIGKSRLLLEFKSILSRQGYTAVSTRSYASAGSVNYGLAVDCLRHELIRPKIKHLGTIWLEELTKLMPELKSEYPELEVSEMSTEPLNRSHLLQAISAVFNTDSKPLILFLDDLQWSDPESITWLDYLLHKRETGKLLVVGSARTIEMEMNRELKQVLSGLRQENKLHVVELKPLEKQESDRLIENVSDRRSDDKIKQEIYRETEGNPLFIIEFLREDRIISDSGMIRRSYSGLSDLNEHDRKLPDRVSAVINSRFQFLSSSACALMEKAAVIGREFTFDTLRMVSGTEEYELSNLLDELLDHRIIRESNSHQFDFTHDKLREVAYSGISRQKRRLYHQRVADAYFKVHEASLEEFSGRLAFHYENAGQIPDAIDWYEKAARNARNVLSKQDVYFYRKAIELTSQLKEGVEKIRLERDLSADLAVSLLHQKEHRADEVVSVCERVRELCEHLNEQPAPPILFSFSMAKLLTGNIAEAIKTGREMYETARNRKDSMAIAKACYIVGGSLLYLKGDVIHSRDFLEEGLQHYNPDQHQTYMKLYDLDAGVVLRAAKASAEWLKSYDEAGNELSKKAFENVLHSDRPFNIVYMHYMMAWWQVLLRNPAQAINYLEKFNELKNTDYELFHWSLHSKVLKGWAKSVTGLPETGIEMMKSGIAEFKEYRFIPDIPYYYGLLAEVLGKQGEFDEAFVLIERAKEFMETYDVRFPEAEIYRAKGELIFDRNSNEIKIAEKPIKKAIQIARKQGTRLFEKRALAARNRLHELKPS
jgi:DNA-binding SARP family transcriptional activator